MHSHAGHNHAHPHITARMLRIALLMTAVYIVLLVIAGVRAQSLALLSEAGHNVSDFLALLLSWVAAYVSERPATNTKTYGWRRTGVLAAFINAGSLLLIALLIFYEAVKRFSHPEPVHTGLMMWTAGAGVVLNGTIALMLMRGSNDLNIRSAVIHEIGDTLSTAAVIAGGAVIAVTGKTWIDPALSVAIAAMVLWSSVGIIRESLNILLEGTPRGMNIEAIINELRSVPGVLDVHDMHIWSIGSDTHALSSHITIADIPPSESNHIMEAVKELLARRYRIHHTTIQFESADCPVAHGCVLPVPDAHHHGHEHDGRGHV